METAEMQESARRESIRRKSARRKYGRYGYGITAAAAAIAITVGLNIVRNSGNMAAGTKQAVMEELAPAASEAIAAETEAAGVHGQDGAASVAGAPQAEKDGQSHLAQALSGRSSDLAAVIGCRIHRPACAGASCDGS